METHKKGKRVLKKLGGNAISEEQVNIIIRNTINDMFLNSYYNMKKIIKDIHTYINEKEGKEITLTDDDIIKMIKIHKMNLINETDRPINKGSFQCDRNISNCNLYFQGFVEDFLFNQSKADINDGGHIIRYNKFTYHDDKGHFIPSRRDPYYYYKILGNLNHANGYHPNTNDKMDINRFLEKIYQIYKINEKDYEIHFFN